MTEPCVHCWHLNDDKKSIKCCKCAEVREVISLGETNEDDA